MSDPVTEYDAAAAFREYFARDPERGKGLTPLGWFLAGHEVAGQDLREAVRAALERHYEEPNPHTTALGHSAAGVWRDDCVVCVVHQAASERGRLIQDEADAARRELEARTSEQRNHVFRDLKR